MFERYEIDWDAYHHRCQTGPCFICEIIARSPEFPAHIIHEDDSAITFLEVYFFALGSNQGNSHVHWHIVPLPPGVPYREQQLGVFRQGILRIPEEEQAALATRIRQRLERSNGNQSCNGMKTAFDW